MAFFPNNNNYLNYRHIYNTPSFSQLNNYQFIQPMNPYINNQFMVNQAIPAQNIKTLRRNNSSIVPMPYGMKFLEYNPNNIYQNQPNIYQDQNINNQIPINNLYSSTSINNSPLYSNLTVRNGLDNSRILRNNSYYKRATQFITDKKLYPHKMYSSSLKPNHYLFIRRKNPKELEEIERERKTKFSNFLEECSIYGSGLKERILLEKQNSPKKYIKTDEALKKENEDPKLFTLGLISRALEEQGIETAIINDEYEGKKAKEGKTLQEIQLELNQKELEEKEAKLSFQLLANGMISKKKYELCFAMEDSRATQIMTNPVEKHKFTEKIKSRINEAYNVPKDEMVVTIPSKNHAQIIFHKEQFDYINTEEFKNKLIADPELSSLIEIKESLLMTGCILSKDQLDERGDRSEWPKNQRRGGEEYNPPEGWIGIGLKAFDLYEDDRWLDMQNREGEWVVAYHGVGNKLSVEEVHKIQGSIYQHGFKIGSGQLHKDCDDYFHPGQKVGVGVYCTPRIEVAEKYAGNSEFNGKKYKTVIMCRVNPKARRHCYKCEESRINKYWVVNGTSDEIRPYRFLYKKLD